MFTRHLYSLLASFIFTVSISGSEHVDLYVHLIPPENLFASDALEHARIASDAFFTTDASLHALVGSRDYYETYFTTFFDLFRTKKNSDYYFFEARNRSSQIIGGLYGTRIKGPLPALYLHKDEEAFCIKCVYTRQGFEKKGIASNLISEVLTWAHEQHLPLVLYTYANHAIARTLYEKFGFTLIADPEHPNGLWSSAAQALLFEDLCVVPPVAYRKN